MNEHDGIEQLVAAVYKNRKRSSTRDSAGHPDEEAMVSFLENKLDRTQSLRIKKHICGCSHCAELIATLLTVKEEQQYVAEDLIERVKKTVAQYVAPCLFEVVLKIKENILELLGTTGDVLVGQELVPAAVLRSREIRDFKDEVVILKDINQLRVEMKIENKGAGALTVTVVTKEKQTQAFLQDLSVALFRNELELESYSSESGRVIFENIPPAEYLIEISDHEEKCATILLDITV